MEARVLSVIELKYLEPSGPSGERVEHRSYYSLGGSFLAETTKKEGAARRPPFLWHRCNGICCFSG